jgi:hypothetical protein
LAGKGRGVKTIAGVYPGVYPKSPHSRINQDF